MKTAKYDEKDWSQIILKLKIVSEKLDKIFKRKNEEKLSDSSIC